MLDPFVVRGTLNTCSWPVPSILRLNDVEFSVETESLNAVSTMGACAVHDHRVETIKTHNQEKVTTLNVISWYVYLVNWSLLNFDAHASLNEIDVGFFHIWRSVASDVWNKGMITNSSNECFQSVEQAFNFILYARTEMIYFKSTKFKVYLAIRWNIESNSVITLEIK